MNADMIKITCDDVESAQDASRVLLETVGSHPPNIAIGALVMATAIAAREMNIPWASMVAMFDRTILEVYAVAEPAGSARTVN